MYISDTNLDVEDFEADAFSDDSTANFVGGCRTALRPKIPYTNIEFGKSVIQKMASKVGKHVKGSDVRVYYSGIDAAGTTSDENLVKYTIDGETTNGNVVTIPGERNAVGRMDYLKAYIKMTVMSLMDN
jgi:hypothetical protein